VWSDPLQSGSGKRTHFVEFGFEFCLSEGCSIFWGLIQAQKKAKGRRKPLSFAFASVLAHSFTRK
jgi:hypothetical protein